MNVTTIAAVEQPIKRFIRVSGTLTAQEDAQVAAEVAGRIVATPVERGSRVDANSELIRIAAAEGEAQAAEAQANAAQIEARLGVTGNETFAVERVPEVANARATLQLARTELERAQQLYKQQLLSQSEFDQKKAQTESAERQYDVARNGAAQQYQALLAARARVPWLKRRSRTTCDHRLPASWANDLFLVGDYVTRVQVASVMRVIRWRRAHRTGTIRPRRHRRARDVRGIRIRRNLTGQVRYVSPSLALNARADDRSRRPQSGAA